eukprot:403333744
MFEHKVQNQPPPQHSIGQLDLRIVRAELFRDTEIIGKMDPYVHVEYNGEQFKTATQKDAGKHPVWDQMFSFPVINMNDEVMVKVYDENSIQKDDLIGMALVKVSSLCQTKGFQDQVFTLQFKDKQAGKILLESRFLSNIPVFQDQPASQPFIQQVQSPHLTHRSQFCPDQAHQLSSPLQYNPSIMSTASSLTGQQHPLYTASQLGVAGAAGVGAGYVVGTQQQFQPHIQQPGFTGYQQQPLAGGVQQQFIPQHNLDPNQVKHNLMGATNQQFTNQQQQEQYQYR